MSYAMLPAALVLAAAERYLAARAKLLKEWEDASVARRVQDQEPGLIGKLLGFKRVTLEQARREYQDSMEQAFHRNHGARWANEANGVRILAQKALDSNGSTVALSSTLANVFEETGAFSAE